MHCCARPASSQVFTWYHSRGTTKVPGGISNRSGDAADQLRRSAADNPGLWPLEPRWGCLCTHHLGSLGDCWLASLMRSLGDGVRRKRKKRHEPAFLMVVEKLGLGGRSWAVEVEWRPHVLCHVTTTRRQIPPIANPESALQAQADRRATGEDGYEFSSSVL